MRSLFSVFSVSPLLSVTKAALTLGLTAALSGGIASSSHAAISIFTSQAEFEAALTSSFLNDFTGAAGTQLNYTASGNGFSYAGTESASNPELTFGTNNLLQTLAVGRNLIFTSTSNNYNAIGGNFFITESTGVFIPQPLTITVSNGTDTITTPSFTPTNATTGSFRGFISTTTPITTLTINNATGVNFASADNLRVGLGVAPAADTAPEPGTLALLTLGGLGMVGTTGMVARKRKAN
jgi:hypothetical protein